MPFTPRYAHDGFCYEEAEESAKPPLWWWDEDSECWRKAAAYAEIGDGGTGSYAYVEGAWRLKDGGEGLGLEVSGPPVDGGSP